MLVAKEDLVVALADGVECGRGRRSPEVEWQSENLWELVRVWNISPSEH